MDEFNEQVEHLVRLAMTPGWWTYARQRAAELDASSVFAGIRAVVQSRLKASGFRPTPQELRERSC